MGLPQALISVLLPVKNGERYLAPAIESVLRQSHENLELIIVDDFSSDYSLSIIESFAARDARVKYWRHGSPAGLWETYNQCLSEVGGQFVKLFQQDAIMAKDCLAASLACFERHPSLALVATGYQIIDLFSEPVSGPSARAGLCGPSGSFSAHGFKPGHVHARGDVLEKCLLPLSNHLGELGTLMFKSAAAGSGFDSRLNCFADLDYGLRIIMEGDYYLLSDSLIELRQRVFESPVASSSNTGNGPSQGLSGPDCRGMMGACDIVKISRKYAKVLTAFGRSQDEFLQSSIAAFLGRLRELMDLGVVSEDYLKQADDLRLRSRNDSAQSAAASVTSAFSALAAVLGSGSSALSFSVEETMESPSLLQDLVDFRLFTYYAVKVLTAPAPESTRSQFQDLRVSMITEPVGISGRLR